MTGLLTFGFECTRGSSDMDPPREKDWDRNGGRWRIGEYMKKVYDKIYWVFALLAAASVGVQGVKTITTPQSRLNEYRRCLSYTSLSPYLLTRGVK